MQPDISIAAKHKLAANPALKAPLQAQWEKVCDRILEHATAMRPKPKSFEVHHLTETARKAFLTAFVENKPDDSLVPTALASIGL